MEDNKTIEKIIEEKRAEMMIIEGELSIGAIYKEIGDIAAQLTLEPIYKEISCKPFYEAGEKDFVTLLYHEILQREPDQEGYINTLGLLKSKQYSKAQLLKAFVDSDEGARNNIKLVGLKKEVIKEKVTNGIKRIPGLGYIGRWFTNLFFLPRRISSLYSSYDMLFLEYKKIQHENEQIKQMYSFLQDQLERQYTVLKKEYSDLETQCSELKIGFGNVQTECSELKTGVGDLQKECSDLRGDYAAVEEQKKDLNNLVKVNKMLDSKLQEICNLYRELKNKYDDLLKQNEIQLASETKKAIAAEAKEKANKELSDAFYLSYNEKLMPDSRDSVKARALPYIEKLEQWCVEADRNKKELKLIDLGCGECEWIELLSENGYCAEGVDSNLAVVNKVKRECPNVKITLADSFEYLEKCPSDSIDCISSFHMVEHMDFITIVTLLKECYRVLKKDGMLIVETPNPQNILTASYYFYLDPTHIKPIPCELLQFYIEESGFEIYDKLLLNPLNFEPYEYKEEDPIKDIVFRFNMEQAYSFMAVKR